jgi:hypothetical protein
MTRLSTVSTLRLLVAALALAAACSHSDTPTQPPPPTTHRIGVRTVGGHGEFYDRATGKTVTPRGANYIRLAPQVDWVGNHINYHSTFNVGLYNSADADKVLARMAADSFNVVRVFLNGCCGVGTLGDSAAGGLTPAYVANLADFLTRAKTHGIGVMLTTDGLPNFGGYQNVLYQSCCAQFDDGNMNALTVQGLTAHAMMWRDLITGLKADGAPLEAVFAYELVNELSFDVNFPPLSLSSGMVSTGNGNTYDMSDAASRQAMMDDNLAFWTSHVRDSIVALDANALVTVGFFEPQGPNPSRIGDPRFIHVYPAIAQSSADFVDLHAYLGGSLTIDQYAQNFGEDAYPAKPVIMGEFGAPTTIAGTAELAAQGLVSWQTGSCPHGFKGWLLWTWDIDGDASYPFWTMTSGDSAVENSLAPAKRANACAP